MKRILVGCILLIFMISFLSASDVEIRFPLKEKVSINLIEDCKIEGIGECGAGFKCNITIYDPNETIMVLSQPMTRNQSTYNYTLSSTQTSNVGVYENTVCCTNSTSGGCNTFYFEVTPSGRILGVSHAIVYIIVLVGSLGLFGLTLFGAFTIPWRNPRSPDGFISSINYLKHFKLGCSFLSYLMLIWILNILIGITNNFLFLDIAFTLFKSIYFILLSGLMIVIPLTTFILVINILEDAKVKKLLERGISFD